MSPVGEAGKDQLWEKGSLTFLLLPMGSKPGRESSMGMDDWQCWASLKVCEVRDRISAMLCVVLDLAGQLRNGTKSPPYGAVQVSLKIFGHYFLVYTSWPLS